MLIACYYIFKLYLLFEKRQTASKTNKEDFLFLVRNEQIKIKYKWGKCTIMPRLGRKVFKILIAK